MMEENGNRTRRPGCKRLVLTMSVLISFIVGLPFCLKSTEVYRTHLPFEAIDHLEKNVKSKPLVLPCRFNVIMLELDSENKDDYALKQYLERLRSLILEEFRSRINKDGIGHGGCGDGYAVTVSLDFKDKCLRAGIIEGFPYWPCGLMGSFSLMEGFSDDNVVDEFLQSYWRGASDALGGDGGFYTILVLGNRNGDGQSHRTVIGKHRHAWIVGEFSESVVVPLIGEVVLRYFMNGGSVVSRHGPGFGTVEEKGEAMPLAADGSAILSFSLLNAEPADWIYDWDFENLEKRFLSPLVEILAPIATLAVESQVLYHTPKAAHSHWDAKLASHVFHVKDLPFFVNSNEWHLDTSVAAAGRSKILQFAIYIPSAVECPLRLKLPNGQLSETNGFTSPGWGGIVVFNPSSCVSNFWRGKPDKHKFSEEGFVPVMRVVVGQIRTLLGLPLTAPHDPKMKIFSVLSSETGFSEWELDVLLRRRTAADVVSCSLTLASLSRLVRSLPNMVIMDEIGDQVQQSLEEAGIARNNSFIGMYHAAAESARKARAWAEEAFFHPSIMSLLYFPTEHHFAIYTPFFVPVLLHTFLAAVKEVMRYQREKKKFLLSNVQEHAS